MEPPAKRMRVSQSVAVDEDDPDFIRNRQQAQAVLKTKFEKIIAKYENMPEWKTDEIDMGRSEIAIDRGHIRSIENNKWSLEAAQFLRPLMGDRVGDAYEELEEDSEDELASPGALIRTRTAEGGRRKLEGPSPHAACDPSSENVQTREKTTEFATGSAQAGPPPVLDPAQLLNALSPALQLAQLPQLPQTPLNLQNHNTLLMGLGQVVLQAVTQVLPQALSNHLGSASKDAIAPPPAITPASNRPTPASDPKWSCPSLPQLPEPSSDFAQSSPIPTTIEARKRREAFVPRKRGRPANERSVTGEVLPDMAAPQPNEQTPEQSGVRDRSLNDLPFATLQHNYSNQRRRFLFSGEDGDRHLKRRALKTAEPEADGSEKRIEQGPYGHDLGSTFDFADTPTVQQVTRQASKQTKPRGRPKRVQLDSDEDRHRQLPTPSTEHSDSLKETHDSVLALNDNPNSQPIYSQDDLELLSLAGDEQEEQHQAMEIEDILDTSAPLEGIILPSIETDSPAVDSEQDDTFVPSRIRVEVQIPRKPAQAIAKTMPVSTPSKRRKLKPIKYVVDPDSEDDISLVPTGESGAEPRSSPGPASRGQDDELDHTTTPDIKREPSTPGPFSFLTAPVLATPKSAPHSSALHSSGVKTGSKMSKSEVAKRIRAQWARQGRAKTPQVVRHRKSLQISKKKKRDEDSEDELA